MFAYSAAGKILMMPALLSYYCKNDLLFPALFLLAAQTAVVWVVAFACSKTNKTFFELAQDAFGAVFSKILMWLFAAFFAAAALLPMLEQKLFVQAIFYDTIPSLITFLPFFILAVSIHVKYKTIPLVFESASHQHRQLRMFQLTIMQQITIIFLR